MFEVRGILPVNAIGTAAMLLSMRDIDSAVRPAEDLVTPTLTTKSTRMNARSCQLSI